MSEVRQVLRARDFPDAMMHRQFLRLAALLYRFNLRDLGHVIRTATTYHRYWSRSDGRVGRDGVSGTEPPPGPLGDATRG